MRTGVYEVHGCKCPARSIDVGEKFPVVAATFADYSFNITLDFVGTIRDTYRGPTNDLEWLREQAL